MNPRLRVDAFRSISGNATDGFRNKTVSDGIK